MPSLLTISILLQVDNDLEDMTFSDHENDSFHDHEQLYVAQPQAESTPYESGMMNPNQQLEQEFLYRQQPGIIALLKYFVKF